MSRFDVKMIGCEEQNPQSAAEFCAFKGLSTYFWSMIHWKKEKTLMSLA